MTGPVEGSIERGRAPHAPGPESAPELRVGWRLLAVLAGIVGSIALRSLPTLGALLVCLIVFALGLRLDLRALARRAVPVLPVVASMILVHGWANPANIHWIGWFGVEGLTYGTITALRLLCFLTVANIFLLTTPTSEVVRWTRERNRDLGLMVSMAFTVMPILSEQMAVTLEAQQVRGMPVGPGLATKFRAYTQVLIPVVVKALTRAEQMSLLLLARGYERPTPPAGEVLPDCRGASVDARGFGFAYRGADAWSLMGVDLTAPAGEMTGVVGGSGSGKSTLLACLAGDPPETPSGFVRGDVLIGGSPYSPERAFAAITLQNPGVHLFETPLAEVGFSCECRGMRRDEAEAAARSALTAAGVGEFADRALRTLSGGERQRVALASALATAPAALMLDEPLEQLDEAGAAEMLAQLRAFARSGRAVVVATRSRELAAVCDACVGLRGGKVVDAASALVTVAPAERPRVMPGAVALALDGVGFRYPQGGGVDDLAMSVRAGETLALLGRNGAGKSTALRLCVGLLTPQSGTVTLLGEAPAALGAAEVSRRAALLFQDPDDQIFNPRVDDEIGWTLKVRGVATDERVARVVAVMRELGLESCSATHPHELSRATRQLVALASALVTEPAVLFLDEPTTALDAESVALALAAVERRRLAGTAVVVVTHDPGIASGWADRIVRIEGGRVVRD
ncbi:MAG TPA: ATP-binding cassette domain-containing protein [Propionibacteriaceae bacterium]